MCVLDVEGSLACALDCLPNAERQVPIRRGDLSRAILFFDPHDALKWTLCSCRRCLIVSDVQDLLPMSLEKGTGQEEQPARQLVDLAPAGWAVVLMNLMFIFRELSDLPACVPIDQLASRADRRLGVLPVFVVWVCAASPNAPALLTFCHAPHLMLCACHKGSLRNRSAMRNVSGQTA